MLYQRISNGFSKLIPQWNNVELSSKTSGFGG
jgi:hypothetical protein